MLLARIVLPPPRRRRRYGALPARRREICRDMRSCGNAYSGMLNGGIAAARKPYPVALMPPPRIQRQRAYAPAADYKPRSAARIPQSGF